MMRIRLLAATLLCALPLAFAAAARADWAEPVASPLTPAGAFSTQQPDLVDLHGTPYVVLDTQSPLSGNTLIVKRLVGGAWQQVGGPVMTGGWQLQSVDWAPHIALVGGRLYVVWAQQSSPVPGTNEDIYVSAFDGRAWQPVGPQPLERDMNLDNGVPVIADVRGAPWVAFAEGPLSVTGRPLPGTGTVVYRYAHGAWTQVGARMMQAPQDAVQLISLAVHAGTPYVAWRENDTRPNAVDRVTVARWHHGRWTRVWTRLNADEPALKELGGSLYLEYLDLKTGTANTLGLGASPGRPQPVGGPVGPVDRGYDGVTAPALAQLGGVLYVAMIEFSDRAPLRSRFELGALKGGAWSLFAPPRTVPGSDLVEKLSFTSSGRRLLLAWGQQQCGGPEASLDVLVAAYSAHARSNLAATSCRR